MADANLVARLTDLLTNNPALLHETSQQLLGSGLAVDAKTGQPGIPMAVPVPQHHLNYQSTLLSTRQPTTNERFSTRPHANNINNHVGPVTGSSRYDTNNSMSQNNSAKIKSTVTNNHIGANSHYNHQGPNSNHLNVPNSNQIPHPNHHMNHVHPNSTSSNLKSYNSSNYTPTPSSSPSKQFHNNGGERVFFTPGSNSNASPYIPPYKRVPKNTTAADTTTVVPINNNTAVQNQIQNQNQSTVNTVMPTVNSTANITRPPGLGANSIKDTRPPPLSGSTTTTQTGPTVAKIATSYAKVVVKSREGSNVSGHSSQVSSKHSSVHSVAPNTELQAQIDCALKGLDTSGSGDLNVNHHKNHNHSDHNIHDAAASSTNTNNYIIDQCQTQSHSESGHVDPETLAAALEIPLKMGPPSTPYDETTSGLVILGEDGKVAELKDNKDSNLDSDNNNSKKSHSDAEICSNHIEVQNNEGHLSRQNTNDSSNSNDPQRVLRVDSKNSNSASNSASGSSKESKESKEHRREKRKLKQIWGADIIFAGTELANENNSLECSPSVTVGEDGISHQSNVADNRSNCNEDDLNFNNVNENHHHHMNNNIVTESTVSKDQISSQCGSDGTNALINVYNRDTSLGTTLTKNSSSSGGTRTGTGSSGGLNNLSSKLSKLSTHSSHSQGTQGSVTNIINNNHVSNNNNNNSISPTKWNIGATEWTPNGTTVTQSQFYQSPSRDFIPGSKYHETMGPGHHQIPGGGNNNIQYPSPDSKQSVAAVSQSQTSQSQRVKRRSLYDSFNNQLGADCASDVQSETGTMVSSQSGLQTATSLVAPPLPHANTVNNTTTNSNGNAAATSAVTVSNSNNSTGIPQYVYKSQNQQQLHHQHHQAPPPGLGLSISSKDSVGTSASHGAGHETPNITTTTAAPVFPGQHPTVSSGHHNSSTHSTHHNHHHHHNHSHHHSTVQHQHHNPPVTHNIHASNASSATQYVGGYGAPDPRFLPGPAYNPSASKSSIVSSTVLSDDTNNNVNTGSSSQHQNQQTQSSQTQNQSLTVLESDPVQLEHIIQSGMFYGKIQRIAQTTQLGCRSLQKKVMELNYSQLNKVVNEVTASKKGSDLGGIALNDSNANGNTSSHSIPNPIVQTDIPPIVQLMVHPLGNYFAQRLFDAVALLPPMGTVMPINNNINGHNCHLNVGPGSTGIGTNISQGPSYLLNKLLDSIAPYFVGVCTNTHGSRSVQHLVDVVVANPNSYEAFKSCFLHCNNGVTSSILQKQFGDGSGGSDSDGNNSGSSSSSSSGSSSNDTIVEIVTNGASNHVLQKCLLVFNGFDKAFFLGLLRTKVCEISCAKHGCCVLQRVLDASPSVEEHGFILDELIYDLKRMAESPYANYVIQYVIKMRLSNTFTRRVLEILCSSNEILIDVCCQKFSSNVIEQCLQYSNYQERTIVFEILGSNINTLKIILSDKFGNYIVQRALDLSQGTMYFHSLISNVRAILDNDITNCVGIRAKLVKKYFPMLH